MDFNSPLVKGRDELWFCVQVKYHIVFEVTTKFFCMKSNHNVSLTLNILYVTFYICSRAGRWRSRWR